MPFPTEFVWGAAAASYQVEGAARQDGRGQSVWDMMCRWPGKVRSGHTGEVACDHYHRYAQDVALMKRIGLHAYRLSICWPRVMPEGVGAVNEPGLDFYDRLVDELLSAGIQPYVTLFHWDYPLELFYRGGWLNRQSVEWFGQYAAVVARRLGDRVRQWMTLNEPQVFCFAGHGIGNHAPGIPLPLAEQLRVVHHVLMAHGRAVQVLRAECPETPQVGWAPVGITKYPDDPSQPEQVEAARADMFAVTGENLWTGAWYSDPVIRGAYPEDGLRQWSAQMPKIESGDMELMAQPLDFYGVNIYHGQPVRLNPETGQTEPVKRGPGFPETHIGWPVAPESLYWGPRFLHERYGLPVYLTENGLSSHDWVALDGRVHDQPRIDFLRRYLLQLERAINDGVDIRGYFQWSILDNFEWAEGYHHRFGLIHVDYETQQRTLKDSAHWYADVIATNGASLRRDAYAQP